MGTSHLAICATKTKEQAERLVLAMKDYFRIDDLVRDFYVEEDDGLFVTGDFVVYAVVNSDLTASQFQLFADGWLHRDIN